jgi:sugar transferase EpsL
MKTTGCYARHGKRVLDVAVAGAVLSFGWPAFLAIAGLVRWRIGAPVIFRQKRPGLDGQPFEIYKFRTMMDTRGSGGDLLSDAERLTPFGKFLRSTSLDELPELWNVLRGDMSLVGPRPLLVEYLSRYSPRQARRHEVRPGITGWAQVNGRNALSWDERFEHDVWYVDNMSLILDLRILLATVREIILRRGVNEPGHATMTPFGGAPEAG